MVYLELEAYSKYYEFLTRHIQNDVVVRAAESGIIQPYLGIHMFFILNFFIRKWASKPKNLKKMLRKSPASNALAAIFKNADFS